MNCECVIILNRIQEGCEQIFPIEVDVFDSCVHYTEIMF